MPIEETHVIWGTGPLGLATMRALVAQGKAVRMINRSGQAAVPANVAVMQGDATNPASTRAACAGAAAIYQCAQPPYHHWPQEFPAFQANILAGAIETGAKLIVAENLYMYGRVAGPMTEDLPNAAHTRKGRTRAQMSEALLAAHRTGRVQVAIARGSDFFGPGVRDSALGAGVWARLVAGKSAQAFGNIDLPHTYTFINDFGHALAVLGTHPAALGHIWHVPNAPTVSTRTIITQAAEQLGVVPKIATINSLMMRLAGLVMPAAHESVEMMYEFTAPFIVDSRKYVQTFGDHATPLAGALEQTIAWYRG